jgi:hypothetical protein
MAAPKNRSTLESSGFSLCVFHREVRELECGFAKLEFICLWITRLILSEQSQRKKSSALVITVVIKSTYLVLCKAGKRYIYIMYYLGSYYSIFWSVLQTQNTFSDFLNLIGDINIVDSHLRWTFLRNTKAYFENNSNWLL